MLEMPILATGWERGEGIIVLGIGLVLALVGAASLICACSRRTRLLAACLAVGPLATGIALSYLE